MKSVIQRILLLLTVSFMCVFTVAVTTQAQEVDFDIQSQKISSQIQADGSGTFEEIVLYDASFMNGATHTIDYKGHDFVDYRVAVIEEGSDEKLYLKEDSSGLTGTYEVTKRDGTMFFKVYYPVENSKVSFVYEYTLMNLVTNYLDTAQFNRKIVGENTDFQMAVEAEIYLPAKVEDLDRFRVWGHGAPTGEVERIEKDGKSGIKVTVAENPPNQFVEVHALFPTSQTPKNQQIVEEEKFDEILAQEEAQVAEDKRNFEKKQQRTTFFLSSASVLSLVVSVLALIYYFKRFKACNPQPVKLPKHVYELPEDMTPAIMASAVLRKEPIALDMTATIVDLARKGYLRIVEEESRPGSTFFNRKGKSTILLHPRSDAPTMDQLMQHERYALQYIFPTGEPISLEELEELSKKDRKFGRQQYALWRKFSNYASARGIMHYPRAESDQSKSRGLSLIAMGLGLLALLASILISTPVARKGVFLTVSAVAFLLAILASALTKARPIKTAEEAEGEQMWQGFANMLNDIGNFNMREIASLELWGEYLVYAISLGVADKVAKAMHSNFSAEELQQLSLSSTYYTNPYLFTHALNDSITSSLRSVAPVSSRSSFSGSNTEGFGGGFSGGSSGGGGGGSGSGGF